MVLHLLPFRRLCAEQRAAGVDQVLPLFVHGFVDQKILLLRPDRGDDPLGLRVAEQPQNAQGLLVQRVHRAQQRGLFIQRLPAVGAERRGDAQGLALDERVAGRVPCGVAPGLESCPQPPRREAGSVRLALNQLFAGKFHQNLPVFHGGDEAVVFFGRDARHGLEPVGKMGGALLQRPLFHGGRHHVRHLRVQRLAKLPRFPQRLVSRLGQSGLHHAVVEYKAAKQFGNTAHL